jgi:hypothetical protein
MVASISWVYSALNLYKNVIFICYLNLQIFKLLRVFGRFITCYNIIFMLHCDEI